jgi:hypothetical protein
MASGKPGAVHSEGKHLLRQGNVHFQFSRQAVGPGRLVMGYYGPTMNAVEAADKNGRAADLQKELEGLFESQNKSSTNDTTSIPATFLCVTVAVS